MVGEEILNASANTVADLITQVTMIGRWVQALGLLAVLWVLFYIISWYSNRKQNKKINKIKSDIERIEQKIDKLTKKK